MAKLAILDEELQPSPGLLDRDRGIDALMVKGVCYLEDESSQGIYVNLVHVVGSTVYAEEGTILTTLIANLARQDHVVTPNLDVRTHQRFIGEVSVHVGSVEEVKAAIQGLVDGDGRSTSSRRRTTPHSHATLANRQHTEALISDTPFHRRSSCEISHKA